MENYIQKSPRALRREQTRRIKKQYKNRVYLPVNKSFSIIKSELVEMGWIYQDNFLNSVDFGSYVSITSSPGIKLVTEKYNISIIPHRQGVEISRLEVWENYQGQGYASLFLDNLMRFLIKYRVKDIYVLPAPAGIGKSKYSLAYDEQGLQSFYQKRGFRAEAIGFYWKLSVTDNIDICKLDLDILSKPVHTTVCI